MKDYTRSEASQSRHDWTISMLAAFYCERGYSVKADHIDGYDEPAELEGYVPDIVATKRNETFVVEVETEDSVHTEHAGQQKLAFQIFARANPNVTVQLHIA